MGAYFSKDPIKQQEDTNEKTTPTKPNLTSNTRLSEYDPRSPSANIYRTPIELSATPIQQDFNITRDTFNLNSPICNKVLPDPRSPAIAFTRTPIVAQEKNPIVLRNKNFDNVLLNETPKRRKPKLLDSTPIKTVRSRKSFAGYLETNLDFVETDLDEVVLRKSLSNLCTKSDYTPMQSLVNRIDNKSVDLIPRNNANNKQNIVDVQRILDNIVDDVFKIEDINRDIIPRIVAISPKPRKIIKSFDKKITDLICEELELNVNKNPTEDENNIIQEENIVIKTLSEDKHSKKIDSTKDCELKSETDAIIVADVKNGEQKVFSGSENTIKRIPLTDRNGSNKTRVIPKLRVHDRPRKSQYTVSKIPQFKGKRISKASNVQCENTPPPPKNASVWDNEETLII